MTDAPNDGAHWKEFLRANQPRYLAELVEILRIPSVSAASASIGDMKRAADWVAHRATKAGIENVGYFPRGSTAASTATGCDAPGKPTILIYAHFDVQPPEPLELWTNPPFEPVREGRMHLCARGSRHEGNLLLALIAVEALLATRGSLPVNVKILFEGQEEIGSRDLGPFVSSQRERLACDLILTPDAFQWAVDQPAIWMAIKGACALQIDLETAAMDLHSGLFGGAVPNAVHSLVELLATMRDRRGGSWSTGSSTVWFRFPIRSQGDRRGPVRCGGLQG